MCIEFHAIFMIPENVRKPRAPSLITTERPKLFAA